MSSKEKNDTKMYWQSYELRNPLGNLCDPRSFNIRLGFYILLSIIKRSCHGHEFASQLETDVIFFHLLNIKCL